MTTPGASQMRRRQSAPATHRLALYGLSGAGKSTTSQLLVEARQRRGKTARVVKLAAPLYELQPHIYGRISEPFTAGQQDQQLLRSLASELRRLKPTFLVNDLLERIVAAENAGVDVVITDDLRDTTTDYPHLVAAGFQFWHLTCPDELREQRLRARSDLSVAPETAATWEFDRIAPHVVLHNGLTAADCAGPENDEVGRLGSLARLRAELEALIQGWWA